MPTLAIDLQTGFEHDAVAVTVDGDTVYEDDDVTTQLLLGYAESVEVSLAAGAYAVDVRLPDSGLAESVTVTLEEDAYLGVSVEDGEIVVRESSDSFGYA